MEITKSSIYSWPSTSVNLFYNVHKTYLYLYNVPVCCKQSVKLKKYFFKFYDFVALGIS